MRSLLYLVVALFIACRDEASSDRIRKLAVDAAAGDSLARYNLGVEFYRGDSIKRDYSKAASLWRQAMEQGNVDAINNYAYLLYYGLGVAADSEKAVALWHRAASLGQPESHSHLADAALLGGTPRDTVEAVARYRAAILLGERSTDSVDALVVANARQSLATLPRLSARMTAIAESLATAYSKVQLRSP